jgi:hypothetical protein
MMQRLGIEPAGRVLAQYPLRYAAARRIVGHVRRGLPA